MWKSTPVPPNLPNSFFKAAGVFAITPCSRIYECLPSSATATETAIVSSGTSRPTYFTNWLIAFASMQEIAPDQPDAISDQHITRRARPASGEYVV